MESWNDESIGKLFSLLEQISNKLSELKPKPRKKQFEITDHGTPVLATLWNKWTDNLPKVEHIPPSSKRYNDAINRWKECPKEDYWVGIIRKINESRFCNGENSRHWKADFGFLVRPDTALKVKDGKYDNPIANKKKLWGTMEDGTTIWK
jgi:hypothetical protein